MPQRLPDPFEEAMAAALVAAGIRYQRDEDARPHLDFYLPDFDVYIEVKQFHSARTAGQMSRAPNVIAVQGEAGLRFMISLLVQEDEAAP